MSLLCRLPGNLVLRPNDSFLNAFFPPISQVNVIRIFFFYSSEIEERGKKCVISLYELELRSIPACQLEILIFSLSSWKLKSIYLPQSWKKFDLIGTNYFPCGTWTVGLRWSTRKQWKNQFSSYWRQSRSPSVCWNLNFTREMMAERS